MKLFAALPLVVVLVSLCGPSAPASNSTISGVVFYDANRNGIQDSCDRPLPGGAVQITGSGETWTATSAGDGSFSFPKIEAGRYELRLHAGAGYHWPLTTGPAEVLEVDGKSDVTGVAVGSASGEPLLKSEAHVVGLVFEDEDADGSVDAGECPLDRVVEQGLSIEYELDSRGYQVPLTGDFVARLVGARAEGHAGPEYGVGDWTQTFPGGDSACWPYAKPVTTYGANLYGVTFGFTRGRLEPATVSAIGFLDANRNGTNDPGERQQFQAVAASHAPISTRANMTCNGRGGPIATYALDLLGSDFAVPPAKYSVSAFRYQQTTGTSSLLITSTAHTTNIDLKPGSSAVIEFGFVELTKGTLAVRVFDGVSASLEDSVNLCYLPTADQWYESGYYSGCLLTDQTGYARVFLPTGPYQLRVATRNMFDCSGCPALTKDIEVQEGGELNVDVVAEFAEFLNVERTAIGDVGVGVP